jgi:hypothetical protein
MKMIGRYLVRVADEDGGHATAQTVLIDWPIWSGKTKYRLRLVCWFFDYKKKIMP